MSLNYNLTKIADYESRCYEVATETVSTLMRGHKKGDTVLKPLTHTLVFISMGVGLGRITEKNWRQWYARASVVEALDGAWRTRSEKDGTRTPVFLTPEDVHSHIGLGTNVSNESDAAWHKRTIGYSVEERERKAGAWLATAGEDAELEAGFAEADSLTSSSLNEAGL